ncbi:MAG: hypothetical protein ACR2QT_13015 [Woeseiaceae bacterium]
MKAMAWTLMLLMQLQTPVFADHKAERQACAAVKKKIRVIEARMRDGYTAAQGIRYEARLRELKDKRYKLCR